MAAKEKENKGPRYYYKENTGDIEEPKTQIAALIQKELKERDMNIGDLRGILGKVAYETVRRYVRGLNIPSNTMLKLLSDSFDWKYEETLAIAESDRLAYRFGNDTPQILGDPDIQRINRAWPLLTDIQKKTIMDTVRFHLKQNEANTPRKITRYDDK